jgi:hypothetical protein
MASAEGGGIETSRGNPDRRQAEGRGFGRLGRMSRKQREARWHHRHQAHVRPGQEMAGHRGDGKAARNAGQPEVKHRGGADRGYNVDAVYDFANCLATSAAGQLLDMALLRPCLHLAPCAAPTPPLS